MVRWPCICKKQLGNSTAIPVHITVAVLSGFQAFKSSWLSDILIFFQINFERYEPCKTLSITHIKRQILLSIVSVPESVKMSKQTMELHGARLSAKEPSKTPICVKEKAKYTGTSKRHLQRKARAARDKNVQQVLAGTPPIQMFFKKQSKDDRPVRKCASIYSSKNDKIREVKARAASLSKRARSTPSGHSTKGHKQSADGAVPKRTRRLSRSTRKNAKAKAKRRHDSLPVKPKLSHLVDTVRIRLESLRRRIRSCSRCSIGQSLLLRDMHTILTCMLENTFNTRDGPCTISHNQAAQTLKNTPGHRTLKHTKIYLLTDKFPQSNRGGKRAGHTLLDEEVFRSKATLWVKEQIALHTRRRLRAIRKKGSKFVSQADVPMEKKETANITSHTFRRFVENVLLQEFYSESAVRARAKAAAAAENMNELEAQGLEEAMWREVSEDKTLFTVSDRTARRWLRELGFKHKHKQSKGVYHDGHDRADVQKYLHASFLPKVKSYVRRTRIMREVTNVDTGETTWEEIPPDLKEGEREVIWVNQDESLFYANDDAGGMWCEIGKNYIAVKGQGDKVHISGLIMYPGGRWVDIETIEPSKDGNWTLPKLEIQITRVLQKLAGVYSADKFEIVFTFDHSTIHTKLPEDALRVTLMGLNPGGKYGDKMRATTWVSSHVCTCIVCPN